MPRSMTGFGVADGPLAGGRIHIEIRTVNHRHFNVQMRLGQHLQPLENAVRAALRARLERGHVSVSARWVDEPEAERSIGVDLDRARAVLDVVTTLQSDLKLPGEIDIGFIARQPDVLDYGRGSQEVEVPEADLLAVLAGAIDGVMAMRDREGAALTHDLRTRLDAITQHLALVRQQAPERLPAERDRLRAAVAELLDGRTVNEDRIAQEIAFLAERLDINEEIVRLETHLAAARTALAGDGPAGRTLGFLSQEMLREINTIGSKANDAKITTAVVAMKGELEKFREQLENIE